jgi:hypothetical protein
MIDPLAKLGELGLLLSDSMIDINGWSHIPFMRIKSAESFEVCDASLHAADSPVAEPVK